MSLNSIQSITFQVSPLLCFQNTRQNEDICSLDPRTVHEICGSLGKKKQVLQSNRNHIWSPLPHFWDAEEQIRVQKLPFQNLTKLTKNAKETVWEGLVIRLNSIQSVTFLIHQKCKQNCCTDCVWRGCLCRCCTHLDELKPAKIWIHAFGRSTNISFLLFRQKQISLFFWMFPLSQNMFEEYSWFLFTKCCVKLLHWLDAIVCGEVPKIEFGVEGRRNERNRE